MIVTKENWPEVKKDLEDGVGRISVTPDGKTVRINSASFNGYDFPVKLIRKLLKDNELPGTVMEKIGNKF